MKYGCEWNEGIFLGGYFKAGSLMSWTDLCQGREGREYISRPLENGMLVRKCHIISATCEAPVYSVAAVSSRSEIRVVHRPLSRGSIFCPSDPESVGLATSKIIFWVCYVIRALETDRFLKNFLNLISIHTGSGFKAITEYATQISWGFLSSVCIGL